MKLLQGWLDEILPTILDDPLYVKVHFTHKFILKAPQIVIFFFAGLLHGR
jgi:hypothetical protein